MNDALEEHPVLPTNGLDAALLQQQRRRETWFWFGYGMVVATAGCVAMWAFFRYVI
jgi:hypothetical protein